MKLYTAVIAAGMNLILVRGAHALVCSWEHCTDDGQIPIIFGCSDGTTLGCMNGERVTTCRTCRTGFTLVEKTGYDSKTGCSYEYSVCEKSCTGCSNCASDTTWSAGDAGYERLATRRCDCNTCKTSWEYRCAAGYWGTTTNGTSGCTQCSPAHNMNATSSPGATAITSCYLAAGDNGADSAGSFTFTQDCYYIQ